MKVEEIAEAIAKLPPDQLARFRRWFTAFEAGRTDHAEELELHGDQTWPLRRPRICRFEKAREGTLSKTVLIEPAASSAGATTTTDPRSVESTKPRQATTSSKMRDADLTFQR